MIDRKAGRLSRNWAILFLLAMSGVALVMLAGRPPHVLVAVFVLAIIKSRLIVLDLMDFRNRQPALRYGLVAWSVILAAAVGGKLLLAGMTG